MDGDWSAFLGAAYKLEAAHIVPWFDVPAQWERFEFMDHGVANPTAWYLCAVDYDGNLIVVDEHYQGETLVSEHAQIILKRRPLWYPEWVDGDGYLQDQAPRVFADPSVTHKQGWTTKHGVPASIATEYYEQSDGQIVLIGGNNDRQAGHARIKELLKLDPNHRFPEWHPLAGQLGAPRLFFTTACENLTEQLQGAMLEPLDSGRRDAGEVVAGAWEASVGHAHAALRYGILTWPDASERPIPVPDDPRVALMQRYEARMNDLDGYRNRRYLDV
jgi:hypothetical protein